MEKNDFYDFDIIDFGNSFEGIAKKDGMVVFIPGSIIGEKLQGKIIKKNKDYCIAKIEKIYSKSKYRIEEPICDVYKRCGGCSALHIDYSMQLLEKKKMVQNVLKKQGLDTNIVENTVGMGIPYYYRNKVQYPIRLDEKGNTRIGFYAKRSHEIIENDCCYIQDRVIDNLSKEIFNILVKNGFKGYNEKEKKGDIRHLLIRRCYHTGQIMVVIVLNSKNVMEISKFKAVINEITKLKDIKCIFANVNTKNTNEILGEYDVKLYGEDYISDYIGDFKYYISPKSFFQVNTIQAEVLYSILKEKLNLKNTETLFDLYSGVGSIGIFLSNNVDKVYGIEIEKQAVKMANLNIKLNNVKNAEYIAGSVEDKIVEFEKRNIKPEVIVVDPPRRGLDEKSIDYILKFSPKKIGYVSCNPATLARDLKLLSEKYDIISISPVDMFPNTEHVEVCALLELKNCQ